jgi:anti-anti-sigma factor
MTNEFGTDQLSGAQGPPAPPPTELAVDVVHRDGAVVLAPRGVIDYWTADRLDKHVHDALEAGARCLVLDLHQTTFVDSTGLALLLSCHRQADAGWLRLADLRPQLRRVLQTTNLERQFDLYPSVEAATSA